MDTESDLAAVVQGPHGHVSITPTREAPMPNARQRGGSKSPMLESRDSLEERQPSVQKNRSLTTTPVKSSGVATPGPPLTPSPFNQPLHRFSSWPAFSDTGKTPWPSLNPQPLLQSAAVGSSFHGAEQDPIFGGPSISRVNSGATGLLSPGDSVTVSPHLMRVDSQAVHGAPFHIPRVASAPFQMQIPRVNSYAIPPFQKPDAFGMQRPLAPGGGLSTAMSVPAPPAARGDFRNRAAINLHPPRLQADAIYQESRSLSPQPSPRPSPAWELRHGLSPQMNHRTTLPAQLPLQAAAWVKAPAAGNVHRTPSPRPSERRSPRPSPRPTPGRSPGPSPRQSPMPSPRPLIAAVPPPPQFHSPAPQVAREPLQVDLRANPRSSEQHHHVLAAHDQIWSEPARASLQANACSDETESIPLPVGLLAPKQQQQARQQAHQHLQQQGQHHSAYSPSSPLLDLRPAGYNRTQLDDSWQPPQAFDQPVSSSILGGLDLHQGKELPATARGHWDEFLLNSQAMRPDFSTPRFPMDSMASGTAGAPTSVSEAAQLTMPLSDSEDNARQSRHSRGSLPEASAIPSAQPNGLVRRPSEPILILPNLPPAGSSITADAGAEPLEMQRALSAPPAGRNSLDRDLLVAVRSGADYNAVDDVAQRASADTAELGYPALDYSSISQSTATPGAVVPLVPETVPCLPVTAMPPTSTFSSHVGRSSSQRPSSKQRRARQPPAAKAGSLAPPPSAPRPPRQRETLPLWRPHAPAPGPSSAIPSRNSLPSRMQQPSKAKASKPKSRPPRRRDYGNMTVVDLKMELRRRGLDCVFCFTREDLVERLLESDRDEEA